MGGTPNSSKLDDFSTETHSDDQGFPHFKVASGQAFQDWLSQSKWLDSRQLKISTEDGQCLHRGRYPIHYCF